MSEIVIGSAHGVMNIRRPDHNRSAVICVWHKLGYPNGEAIRHTGEIRVAKPIWNKNSLVNGNCASAA